MNINLLTGNDKYICLELECGNNKKFDNLIGTDNIIYDRIDVVVDVVDKIKNIFSNSIDYVYASHFLSNVSELNDLIFDIVRIMKVRGKFEVIAPHFSNPYYYYSDPTHFRFFVFYTMFFIWLIEFKEDACLTIGIEII